MLKPVDLQTIMPRSVDLQRVQQAQNNRVVTDQQDFSRELFLRSQTKKVQIQNSEAATEQNKVQEDNAENRKRRNYRRFGQTKKVAADSEADNSPEEGRGMHIDIKM
jgi:hypothetical protein